MTVWRVTFNRYQKADGVLADQHRTNVLITAEDDESAEDIALSSLESGPDADHIRFEWCGTSRVGD